MTMTDLTFAQFEHLQAVAKGAFTGQNRTALACEQQGWVSRGRLTPEGWHVLQGARESPPARTGRPAPPKARTLGPLWKANEPE